MSTMVFVDTHACVYIKEKEERWRVKIGEGSRKPTIHNPCSREREIQRLLATVLAGFLFCSFARVGFL